MKYFLKTLICLLTFSILFIIMESCAQKDTLVQMEESYSVAREQQEQEQEQVPVYYFYDGQLTIQGSFDPALESNNTLIQTLVNIELLVQKNV